MSEINNNEVIETPPIEDNSEWANAEVSDELKKEAQENKEVLDYSDSAPDKFMNWVNEHEEGAEVACCVMDGMGSVNDYSEQLEAAKEFSQPQTEIVQEVSENNSGDIKTQLEQEFPDVQFDL
jgi:hypothetical protein